MTTYSDIVSNQIWRRIHAGLRVVAAGCCVCTLATVASGQDIQLIEPDQPGQPARQAPPQEPMPQTAPPAAAEPTFIVSEFTLRYRIVHPQHIPLENVMNMPMTLTWADDRWYAPRPESELVSITLAELNARGDETYHASAIQYIIEAIRDVYVDDGYLGVFVGPDPTILTPTGVINRPADMRVFPLVIATGVVTEVRTLASGDRIDPADRINNPLHQRILDDSPVKPFDPGSDELRSDLLNKATLDDFVFHKSRHPGRRLDVALATAADPQTVALDYMVTENNPLVIYFQVANTGTRQTGRWRERIGLFHSQLTNNDDILAMDFSTNEFSGTNAFNASYDAPFPGNDRIRWKVFGSWNEFSADQVGFFTANFTGETWSVGGEIAANIYQHRELFVDLFASLTYYDIKVNNPLVGTGKEQFLIPRLGVRYDRTTEWFSTQGQAFLEYGSLTSLDSDQLELLGRTAPDRDWVKFAFAGQHSVYLEPLLDRAGWEDPSTPHSSTLAHELLFRTSGQFVFNDKRVVPQFSQVAGGLYTVRGYPESAAVGDNVFIGSVEYRFHVPKSFEVEPEPRELFGEPFRSAPQFVYGRPDWDLILKAFVDFGYVDQNDAFAFESSETLVGVGVGVELQLKRNLNLRLDWGFALEEVESADVNDGDNRLHFVGTILF